MISKELFLKKLKRASLLTGQKIEIEVSDALYEELKNEHESDILKGLNDLAYSGDRINLRNIITHANQQKTKRLEEEAKKQKEIDKEEAHKFFNNKEMPKEVKEFIKKLLKK